MPDDLQQRRSNAIDGVVDWMLVAVSDKVTRRKGRCGAEDVNNGAGLVIHGKGRPVREKRWENLAGRVVGLRAAHQQQCRRLPQHGQCVEIVEARRMFVHDVRDAAFASVGHDAILGRGRLVARAKKIEPQTIAQFRLPFDHTLRGEKHGAERGDAQR